MINSKTETTATTAEERPFQGGVSAHKWKKDGSESGFADLRG